MKSMFVSLHSSLPSRDPTPLFGYNQHASVLAFLLIIVSLWLYRRMSRTSSISLSDIAGPPSSSWLLGNLPELIQGEAGVADFKWQEQYGAVFRVKASFGEDRLVVSDPKSLQYILRSPTSLFRRPPENQEFLRLMIGRGIIWSDDGDHHRHRKVMSPAFSAGQTKSYLQHFRYHAQNLCKLWKAEIASATDSTEMVLDVPTWLSRATLDVIGEAAFDYPFDSLNNGTNEIALAYSNLFADSLKPSSSGSFLFMGLLRFLPPYIVRGFQYLPSKSMSRLRHTLKTTTAFAKELVEKKITAAENGDTTAKDAMSILVKENIAEKGKGNLSEEEIFAQVTTLLMAGHETTANGLVWTLYELAMNPEIQKRLRAEIMNTRASASLRGDEELTIADLESMEYMTAFMKEILRYHAVVPRGARLALQDTIIPLFKPIKSVSGKWMTEIPIPKGTRIFTSLCGYNRNKDIWGEDAHEFKPERWLDNARERQGPAVGVYANLMTFSTGMRACLGWRFSVIEMQAFLIELVENFSFSMPKGAQPVFRAQRGVMIPIPEGEDHPQLQLVVSLV